MQTVEILQKAKSIIQDPKHWTQGQFNEDRNGVMCFCALGAIAKARAGENDDPDYNMVDSTEAAKYLADVVSEHLPPYHNFAAYNDKSTHAEVLAAFDKAIELAKAA